MRYLALATDYDGTLATHGEVDSATLQTLGRLLASGRKLILVTGRELPDLQRVFPRLDLFARVVAENGALLYRPATREVQTLCEGASERFLERLRERALPFSAGQCIVATWEPHQTTVLEVIRELGLELQVIFNKGAVMVLPSGTNKRTGLLAALDELGLSSHNCVAVGDAENDHAFLAVCECAVTVANALPMLKQRSDWVTPADHGAGVAQLIEQMISDDLRTLDARLTRHQVLLGNRADAADGAGEVFVTPYRGSMLFAGPSGSGKSTAATGVLERMAEKGYQFCLVDPEGDYEQFSGALSLGDTTRAASVSEVMHALESPRQNVVVNLLGIPVADRPLFFASLLPHLLELRARTARPHWIIVDEAHHMLPSSWVPAAATMPQSLDGMILITVHPEHIAAAALAPVEVVVAVGKRAGQTLAGFSHALGEPPPQVSDAELETGQALVWFRSHHKPPMKVCFVPGRADRRRHLRKYAQGELPPHRSFFFRGPEGKLNLRAQNLVLFTQMADGVDDDTWLYHLRRGDYSRWFREFIKDDQLAAEAEQVEKNQSIGTDESRKLIRHAIEQRYTAAA